MSNMTNIEFQKEQLAKKQIEELKPQYYKLIDDRNKLQTQFRLHFSAIIITLFGILSSLHHTQDCIVKEWIFFVSIIFGMISFFCILLSALCELKTTEKMLDKIKRITDEAINLNKPISEDINIPRLKQYDICYKVGMLCFIISVILFLIIQVPQHN